MADRVRGLSFTTKGQLLGKNRGKGKIKGNPKDKKKGKKKKNAYFICGAEDHYVNNFRFKGKIEELKKER